MASLPTKIQEHGKRSIELVVALLPTQRHNPQQPPTKLKLRGLAENQN